MWTFGRRIAVGFALSFVLLLAIGGVSYRSLDELTKTSYAVAHTHNVLERTSEVLSLLKDAETGQRGFVITADPAFLEPYHAASTRLPATIADLRSLTSDNASHQRHLGEIAPLVAQKLAELDRTIELRRAQGFEATQKVVAAGEGKRAMDQIRTLFDQMDGDERALLKERAAVVEATAGAARATILYGTGFCLLLVFGAALLITRSLSGQIGMAVSHVESSSAELQSAANQQVSGAKESSTAMSEITTTISELLATSRQIAESAQRVAQVAEQTSSASRAGDTTVQRTSDSVGGIKRQVDMIVTHMLDLGRKSQQIGGILEIINELAEQTNILAINATIEAAGAGEAGRRFAVVADEIRKLADRVGGSTKEIRTLIEEIRAAVNSTVMATEGGTKVVDTGARQFGEVAAAFKQIIDLVATTSEAAREIELSTKQQSSAVEQVNEAIANVAKATRESEASSSQTLQTATQLSTLSRELTRMIRPPASA